MEDAESLSIREFPLLFWNLSVFLNAMATFFIQEINLKQDNIYYVKAIRKVS